MMRHIWSAHNAWKGDWHAERSSAPLDQGKRPLFMCCWCGRYLSVQDIDAHMGLLGGWRAHLYDYLLGVMPFDPLDHIPF